MGDHFFLKCFSTIFSNWFPNACTVTPLSGRLLEKGKLILVDVSLLKDKYVSIKNIGWLIKFRYNSFSINEALLELLSIYLIVVVQSWKSTTLKMINGIKDVFLR